MHGAARYTASSNDLARALAMAGRYREAWDVGSRNVELVSRMGRADTNGYLAMLANACSALRSGGQPVRALAYLEARTAKIPHAVDYADMPMGIQGCWGLARLQKGGADDADAALVAMADSAERSGFPSALVRVWLVNSAIARGNLAQADERWARLAPDEQRRLAATEKGVELVRLMILEARLALAHQRPDDSLSILERARALITARGQPRNPDIRELEGLQSSVLLAQRQFAKAIQHAQAAVEQARDTAVDTGSSAWLGEALVLRARAEAAAGRPVAAASAQEALPHLTENLDSGNLLIAEARRIAAASVAASR
jgi:tetratricopeptide (TPR) repeat protein